MGIGLALVLHRSGDGARAGVPADDGSDAGGGRVAWPGGEKKEEETRRSG